MLHHDAPCNPQRPSEPIHIRPAQTQGLADPEPERHAQQSRRADRFIQVSDELTELIFRQRSWFPSLHCTLDGYQLHRDSAVSARLPATNRTPTIDELRLECERGSLATTSRTGATVPPREAATH